MRSTMTVFRVLRVCGGLAVVACLLVACLPRETGWPASFAAFLRSEGLAFESGPPAPDVIRAIDVIQFPGQSGPPVFGVLSCVQQPCSVVVRDRGGRRAVWLATYPGPLSDDGRGWALIDAYDGTVIAISK